MLIRVIIGNLYSFREKTEFNMLTGKVRTHPHHVHNLNKVQVVRTGAIYGANGAGKSNLVKALDLLCDAAISERIPNEKISPFKLGGVPADLPYPHIEVEVNIGKKNYLYGLELAHNRVAEEWLYESGLGEKPDTLIFERKTDEKGETKITFAPKYESNAKAKLRKELYESEILKPLSTLLWQLNQAKETIIKEATDVFVWLDTKVEIIYPHSTPDGLMHRYLTDAKFKEFCEGVISSLNTGVSGLRVKATAINESDFEDRPHLMDLIGMALQTEDNILSATDSEGQPFAITKFGDQMYLNQMQTLHGGVLNEKSTFELEEESDGTRRLIEFLLAFYGFVHFDLIIIIDEIERSIHPSLIKTILQKLMTEKDVKGQLIFTTHESNLLDLSMLRPDEIWFAEKNETSATSFYPLSDFQIRPDLDVEKGYLMGRFGAIPILTDLKKLNWHDLTHAQN